jgi:hypothetical protein
MTNWTHKLTAYSIKSKEYDNNKCDIEDVGLAIAEELKETFPNLIDLESYLYDEELADIVERFEEMSILAEHDDLDEDYFNMVLSLLYDWADTMRVWIEPNI